MPDAVTKVKHVLVLLVVVNSVCGLYHNIADPNARRATTKRPQPTSNTPSSNPDHCPSCSCGVPYDSQRIVNGQKARLSEHPWMVLLYAGNNMCGGSLITDQHILTAAHCIHGISDPGKVFAMLHPISISNITSDEMLRISKIIKHPKYNTVKIENDIAILKLEKPVNLTDEIPICLPNSKSSFTGVQATVAGWGTTREGGKISDQLLKTELPIWTAATCKRTLGRSITDNMICAGYRKGGKDSCQGDSGGPLSIHQKKSVQIGIVSFGFGCARPNAPGVYTRITKYMDWIKKNTKESCYCLD